MNFRKSFVLSVIAVMTVGQTFAQKYVDASTLTIEGRTQIVDGKPYARVDNTKYSFDNRQIEAYCNFSAGVYVLFKTDSKNISAKWQNTPRATAANMTPILQRGLDLYIKRGGKWVFAGVGRPAPESAKGINKGKIIEYMADGEKECMLYLPIWCAVEKLEIGIDEGAFIEPLASPYKYKVIVLGSSITHGAAAGRPGLTYTARMSRQAGIDFVNLGFSGNCKLQPEFARLIAETEADAYMFDAFSNPSAKEIEERVADFVKTVAEAHPDKPMIFIQTTIRDRSTFDTRWAAFEKERRETVRTMMTELAAAYDNVYFLDSDDMLGHDHEATTDDTHPNDVGFARFADTWLPKVLKVLKKYGIK